MTVAWRIGTSPDIAGRFPNLFSRNKAHGFSDRNLKLNQFNNSEYFGNSRKKCRHSMRSAYDGINYRRISTGNARQRQPPAAVARAARRGLKAIYKIHKPYYSLHHLSQSGRFKLKCRTASNIVAREEQNQHKIPAGDKPAKIDQSEIRAALSSNAQRDLKPPRPGNVTAKKNDRRRTANSRA
ncbi:hypothetical protein G3N59_35230 [Paraburkholderia sp. Ac-20340]|uniref:hypothetical protein n=1 Tax=Paraburkholderia sp. Ac-20340 TaxID=2703888 RepID=UPI00197E6A41|nr:hypothetical protein [Paraburkholderia sp. Ac-20340]MBN3858657.1 hypothetical protein [Paraburkholderia sp. Ac-20340]